MTIALFNTSLQINADLFGYLALGFFAFSFLMQSTRKTFLAQAPADACYGIHFLMLGSLTGCMVSLAAACRDLFAGLASERIMRIAIFIYLGLIWSVTFFTFNNDLTALLPASASSLASCAMLLRNNYYHSRYVIFAVQSIWLCFFISIGSIPGIVGALGIITMNIIGLMRYHYDTSKRIVPA